MGNGLSLRVVLRARQAGREGMVVVLGLAGSDGGRRVPGPASQKGLQDVDMKRAAREMVAYEEGAESCNLREAAWVRRAERRLLDQMNVAAVVLRLPESCALANAGPGGCSTVFNQFAAGI